MIPPLQARFDRLEERRRSILARVHSHPEVHQTAQPRQEEWSMVQVIEHLVLAEEATLKTFHEGPPPTAAVTLRSRAILQFIYAIFRLGIRVKVPVRALAPAAAPLRELETRWQDTRVAIATFLEQRTAPELTEPRFRHPVAGWLTLVQGLDFLARHIGHHERQVGRIRKALGEPS